MFLPVVSGTTKHQGLVQGVPLTDSFYANVVVDIQARELTDRLFTYRVPPYLASEVFVGSQVLVPFGTKQLVGGYIVSFSNEPERRNIEIREISEILDPEPLFDRVYVDFLHWLADFYCSSLSDVIQAALPADFSPRVKRMVRLIKQEIADHAQSESFTTGVVHALPSPLATAYSAKRSDLATNSILTVLKSCKGFSLSMKVLKQRWKKVTNINQSHFYQALNVLRQEGVVWIGVESSSLPGPKIVKVAVWTGKEGETARQRQILSTLARHGGQMSLKELMTKGKTTLSTVRRLEALGMVALAEEESLRNPLKGLSSAELRSGSGGLELTEDQKNALLAILPELRRQLLTESELPDKSGQPAVDQSKKEVEGYHPWLIFGVTGSGKTEVYLRLISETLAHGKSALYLVPEISLTPQLAKRLTDRFGDKVAIWHSALSPGERYDTWRRLRNGDVRVLLGARSAVLAPIPDLGIIIVDEEHDGSYKQTNPSPRYHAREVAIEKARRHSATIVMGSATPDLCSYTSALGTHRLLKLPERVLNQKLPDVTIIDMRQEFASGNRTVFSSLLLNSLSECLDHGEQAILLINRRGYASHVFCRACGFVVKCRNCSVSLVFHQGQKSSSSEAPQPTERLWNIETKQQRSEARPGAEATTKELPERISVDCVLSGASIRAEEARVPQPTERLQYEHGHLACHHCGHRSSPVVICPNCTSPFIRQFGLGTQKVEQEVKEKFTHARIARLDSDVASKRGAYEQILREFGEGRADILIGTQMVSKGLDIPNVTLVGVLAADSAFNLPDYRSVERGFQLLTQVAGRAGRGDKTGSVIFQTYNTEMPALNWARNHDYEAFAQEESEARRAYLYPPFSQLIRVVVSGEDSMSTQSHCERLAENISHYLEDALPDAQIKLLGPAPCIIERLRNKFRFHLLIKNMTGELGRVALTSFLRNKRLPHGMVLSIDVDALDLL